IKKYPKVKLIVEEYNTEEIISRLQKGQLDAAIAATPLKEPNLKELVLYYEPFVGYFPPEFRNGIEELTPNDLHINDVLLLQDGHCFTNGILNICKASKLDSSQGFELNSGSFETLIRLSNEGLGVTLLPFLHTLNLNEEDQKNLIPFKDPKPSREVSLIYPKSELKIHLIEALRTVISGVIRGAIAFHDVEIISPKLNRN
ncbi:MAG TPA: LysR substrate-binding domain-containing protein, partial [Flavobacterium sp.]|nr:LysR substrate-binding domain-containing protein [Flavobacterium sp.]